MNHDVLKSSSCWKDYDHSVLVHVPHPHPDAGQTTVSWYWDVLEWKMWDAEIKDGDLQSDLAEEGAAVHFPRHFGLHAPRNWAVHLVEQRFLFLFQGWDWCSLLGKQLFNDPQSLTYFQRMCEIMWIGILWLHVLALSSRQLDHDSSIWAAGMESGQGARRELLLCLLCCGKSWLLRECFARCILDVLGK